MKDVRSLQSAFGYERDVTKVEQLIGQILELLADAEGVSRKYGTRTKPDDESLAVKIHLTT